MTASPFTISGRIEITVPSTEYPGDTVLVGYALKSPDTATWGAYTILFGGCSLTEHPTAQEAIQAVQNAYLHNQAATVPA